MSRRDRPQCFWGVIPATVTHGVAIFFVSTQFALVWPGLWKALLFAACFAIAFALHGGYVPVANLWS